MPRTKRKQNHGKIRTKTQAERKHSIHRAFERYGFTLVRKDLEEIKFLIQTRFATFLRHQSRRVSHYLVPWEGDVLGVVYDHVRKTPITILTVEQILTRNGEGFPSVSPL